MEGQTWNQLRNMKYKKKALEAWVVVTLQRHISTTYSNLWLYKEQVDQMNGHLSWNYFIILVMGFEWCVP